MEDFFVTLDVDWAPDFVIDDVAELLIAAGVRATWFITHASAAVERLRRRRDLFELGIHPNFLPGSTHGKTPREVLGHMLSLVPEAVSARSHAVFQSAQILQLLIADTSIRIDSSLLLPGMSHIQPVVHRIGARSLLRVPVFWADDYALANGEKDWSISKHAALPGCKVMDFHPIHVFLNSAEPAAYASLKLQSTSLQHVSETLTRGYIHTGRGVRTMFCELVDRLARDGASRHLRDLDGTDLLGD